MKRPVLILIFFVFLLKSVAQPCHTIAITPTNVLCHGGNTGAASVSVTGGTAPYTYTWSPVGGNTGTATGLATGIYTVTVADAGTCVVSGTVNVGQPNFFMAVSTQTNLLCYDGVTFGVASFTTIGGTNPKTYTWSPYGGNALTATGLSPGTFTFFIRDANNCNYSETVTITGPSFSLTGVTSQTNNICGNLNGRASIFVTGGTTPYSYTWSPTGGNAATTTTLASGVYTVQVRDANNCSFSQTVNIIQSSQFTLTPTITNVSCNGAGNGSVTTSVSGGTAPFTYTWIPSGGNSSSAVSLVPGNYTLAATDGLGCLNSVTAAISQPPTLSITPSQTLILCNGGTASASVNVTGGVGPYTYTWLPSGGNAALASGLPAGSYTVTARDANLCVITQTFNFTQPPALTTSGSQTNIVCYGTATGEASVAVSGGVPPYTYTWSPSGGSTVTAFLLNAGVYTLTARDNNSCTVTRTYTITEQPQITVSAAVTTVVCNGQNNGSATLTVSGGMTPYSYTWSPSGGNASSASSLAGGVYTVHVSDGNNCITSPTFMIAEPLLLTPNLATTAVSCFGLNNGSASLSVTGGVAPYSYTWMPGGLNTSSVSSLVPGNYTVTVQDANLCTTTQTFAITSPAQYTISASVTNILCGGQNTGSATVTVLGGTPAYTYTWLPSGGNASVTSGRSAGDYSVTIRDANNCTETQTITITEPPVLTGTVETSAANCNNADGSATVSVSGGAGIYSYSWTPTGGTTATITAVNAGEYTCTVTDQNSCTFNLVASVAPINPSVNLNATAVNICSGGTTTLSASGSVSYTWSPLSSLSSTVGATVIASPTITTTYSVTGESAFGCVVSNTLEIQVYPDPAPLLSINADNFCSGSTASLSAAGALNYTWSPAAGLSDAFVSHPTYTLSNPVIFTVTGADAIGCTGSSTLSVSPLPVPDLTITASTSAICLNESVTLTVLGANSYSWSNSATTSSIQVSPGTTTSFTAIGTGANGCAGNASVLVTVHPLPSVSITSNTLVCQGLTSELNATGAVTYTWNTGETGATLSVSPVSDISYQVTGTDVNGCVNTASINLVVNITPTISIIGRQEVCQNESLVLNAIGGTTYTWSTGQEVSPVTYTLNTSSVITVSSGIAGCPPGTASISVTVNPRPTLSVPVASVVLYSGQSEQLAASGNGTQYFWSPAAGLSCVSCPNPIAQPSVTTIYTVESTNSDGCKSTQTISVLIDSSCGDLFAPSAFSPNEDGSNDTWCIYGNCIRSVSCEIYNRWGQKVFTITDINQCWDGKINGVSQNTGVFIFQASITLINGETKSINGNFTLIK